MSVNLVDIPLVNAEQAQDTLNLTYKQYNIQPVQILENAGHALACLARRYLQNDSRDSGICVAIGNGFKSAIGMVAARHLTNWGVEPSILMNSKQFDENAGLQWKILANYPVIKKEGNMAINYLAQTKSYLIIDAILDDGLIPLESDFSTPLIRLINETNTPVLSVDVPSGFNGSTGEINKECVEAQITLSLGLPKIGLLNTEWKSKVGHIFLADIGIPTFAYEQLGIKLEAIFSKNSIIDLKELWGQEVSSAELGNDGTNPLDLIFRKNPNSSCFILG